MVAQSDAKNNDSDQKEDSNHRVDDGVHALALASTPETVFVPRAALLVAVFALKDVEEDENKLNDLNQVRT